MSTLYVVGTPIGNLGDFSPRAKEILSKVKFICSEDTRHSKILLNCFEINTPLVSYHKFNEKERTEEVISKMLKDDIEVAVITDAGMPCISDPGSILVNQCIENGIKVLSVPGPSAVVSALSVSGFYANEFTFMGFFPTETKNRKEVFEKIKSNNFQFIVFYESPKRVVSTVKAINKELGNVEIALVNDLTKFYERVIRGYLNDLIGEIEQDENIEKGEYVIIVDVSKIKVEKTENVTGSIESQLVDTMIKNNISLKDAINILSKNSNISKKEIYSASLNLKSLFK